jgi:hypothetical protein
MSSCTTLKQVRSVDIAALPLMQAGALSVSQPNAN